MNKNYWTKRIEKIHAAKCNKSSVFQAAQSSSNILSDLKIKVAGATDDDAAAVAAEINAWQAQEPMISDNEVVKLMKGK